MFLQWSKIAFSLALVAGLYLMVLGTDFLREWIRDERFDCGGRGARQRDPDGSRTSSSCRSAASGSRS